MKPGPSRDIGCAGFTLVELLVALALCGLISLLLLQGVGMSAHGLDRLSSQVDRLDERRGVEIMLRRALGSAVAIPVYDGEPGFIGRPASLSFLSVVADGGAGLYRIRLALDPSRSPARVILTRRLAGRSAPPNSEQSLILRDIHGLAIDYFGAPSPAAEPGWQRHWDGMARLPLLVRITLDPGLPGDQPIILRLRNAG